MVKVAAIGVLTGLCLATLSLAGQVWQLRAWLDRQLVEHVRSDAPEDNFNWAKKVLTEDLVGTLDGGKFQEHQLKEELKKFLDMEPMSSDKSCDERGFAILVDNDLANGNWENRRENNQEKMKRVDKIYREVMLAHAKTCGQIYLDRFSSQESQVEDIVKRDVSILFDKLLEQNTKATYGSLVNPTLVQIYLLPAIEKLAELAKIPNYIRKLRKKKLVTAKSKVKVRVLADMLVREPCSAYIEQWGLYFRMVKWDDEFVQIAPSIVDTATREFNFARGRYKLCTLVEKNWQKLEDLIVSVARNGK